jgi:hypothetical protein
LLALGLSLGFVHDIIRAEDRLLIVDESYGLVWTIDAESGSAVGGFSLPAGAISNTIPRGDSALAVLDGELFYTSRSTSRIWVLDAATGALLRSLDKPSVDVTALDARTGALLVVTSPIHPTGGEPGEFFRINVDDGSVIEQRQITGLRDALAYSESRNTYYLRVGSLEVLQVDVDTFAETASASPPAAFVSLSYDAARDRLFGVTEDCLLYRLDPQTLEVEATVTITDSRGRPLVACGGIASADVPDPEPTVGDGGNDEGAPVVFTVQDRAIPAGGSTDVPIVLTTTLELEGFVIAAVHDPAALQLTDVHVDGTDTADFGADFVGVELFPNGGTLGVVFDLIPPFEGNTMPPGRNYVAAKFNYACLANDLAGPSTTEVRLVDNVVGNPPKENIVISSGVSISPFLLPGRITCEPREIDPNGPKFFCGGAPVEDGWPTPLDLTVGDPVDLCFFYSFPEPAGDLIQGFSMTLAYDCRLACDPDSFVIPPGSILEDLQPDFVEFDCENDADDGDGCEIIFAVLLDSRPPFEPLSLPRTTQPLLVGCVEMLLVGSVRQGECLEVVFRDGINGSGRVPIRNVVAVDNHSVTPTTEACEICVPDSLHALLCGSPALGDRGFPLPPLGGPGDVVDLCFWYTSPGEPVVSLAQAVRIDCRAECIDGSFEIDPSIEAFLGGASIVVSCENDGSDGDPCELVLRVIPDPDAPPGTPALPESTRPQRIGCVRVRVDDRVPPGSCLAVEYYDGASGADGVSDVNRMEIPSGSVEPQLVDCEICLPQTGGPKFLCGGPNLGQNGLPDPPLGVERGETTEICLWYCSPEDPLSSDDDIQGLSMALCFDCALFCFEDSFYIPPDSVTAQLGAEFVEFHCDNDPNDGDGCEAVLALLVDYLPPFDGRTLPATNVPQKLACFEVQLSTRAALGVCKSIDFCDSVNGRQLVPIKNLVAVQNKSLTPGTRDCEVCTESVGAEFYCGAIELGPERTPLTPTGYPGEPAEVCFYYTSPRTGPRGQQQSNPVQGLVMALTYDCRISCIEDSLRIPAISAPALYGPPDFVDLQCDNDPDDGDGCELILALLMDAQPPFDVRMLPPTDEPLLVACVDFFIPADRRCGDCFNIRFENKIDAAGRVPAANIVAIDNRSFTARTFDCELCVVERFPEPEFRRGDCDLSGEVDIADGARIVSLLFGIGTWQPDSICDDACDTNDDGRVDLADVHATLLFLFAQGREPPLPGPYELGVDPTSDKLGCPIVEDPCPIDGALRPPR